MKFLWLAWLPLLFLPNYGVEGKTSFGTLEVSDYLIVPYLPLVALGGRGIRGRRLSGRVAAAMGGFLGWALVSTLLIRERYVMPTDAPTIVGLLKIGKMALYGVAGLLTARAVGNQSQASLYRWALLASGIVVALALYGLRGISDELRPGQSMEGYKTKNATSLMLAMILCYLGGLWVAGEGTPRWRAATAPGLVVMILGLVLSDGRGGWVAAFVGGLYLLVRQGIRPRVIGTLAVAAAILALAYGTMPEFQMQVDRTFWPDRDQLRWYKSGVGGVDDGARLDCWLHELAAVPRAPLFGTGMFHRGRVAGIWMDGSHNFFLQMFLETGVPGGLVVVAASALLWRQSGSAASIRSGQVGPLRAGLVAAMFGGMTGEYFYGGTVLFTLLLIYAPVGSFLAPGGASRGEIS